MTVGQPISSHLAMHVASHRAPLAVLALTCLLGVLPVAGATDGPDEIVPSGVLRSETRQPGVFSRIAIDGPMNVEVRQGPHPSVTLKADDNVLPLLETTLNESGADATLRIRYRKNVNIRTKPHVDVIVETERVEAITLGGVGDIVAKGLKTPKLDIVLGGVGRVELPALQTDALKLTIAGSGTITSDGHAKSMSLSIGGSGNTDTTRLAADDVTVTIAGSGNAKLRADKTLGVTIAGSGNVVHVGDAAPHTTVLGSGKITKG